MENVRINNRSIVNFGSRQRGASLLEGIAYLGIAALVILGAVSLLTGAFTSAQSNRGAEEIVSIRTGVKKLYMGQAASYGTADITGALNTAKIFPSTLTPNGTPATAMNNAWNGTVKVQGATNTFDIIYTGVPQDACISMVSGANGWTKIAGPANNTTTFPVTPDAAASVCSATTNTVTFTSL